MLEWLKTILGEGYTEEIDRQVSEAIGRGFVAKADYNAKNEAYKALQAGGISQEDVDALRQQLEEEKNGRLKDRREFVLKSMLAESGCKDSDYLLYKLGDSAAFDETGGLQNAEEFLGAAKKNFQALFEPRETTRLSGLKPAEAAGNPPEARDMSRMSYEELCAHLKKHTV